MCGRRGRAGQCLWSLWRRLLQIHTHRGVSPFTARALGICASPKFEVRGVRADKCAVCGQAHSRSHRRGLGGAAVTTSKRLRSHTQTIGRRCSRKPAALDSNTRISKLKLVRFCSPPMFQTWQHRSISCRAILALVRVGRGRVKLRLLRSNLRGPREARHGPYGASDFARGAGRASR